jgi:glycosyltransferase involved in cell wall biosynthesis
MTYARALRALAAEQNYDVFVVEGTMALYSWLLRGDKLVIDEIDIYSRVAFQEYRLESNAIRRLFAWFEWKRTRMFEFMALRKSAGVMVRSRSDRDWLVHQSGGIEISVISPWFEGLSELLSIEPRRPDGSKILFMGALKNPKNSAAVQFFVSKIFPLIKNAVPGAIFFVVGDAPPPVIREFGHDSSIIVTGEVESLKRYYEQAAVVVVPLLVGGGIIVKTLNGMAAGRPTVSTAPGVSGIDARPDQDLIVVPTDPIMFADAVIRILTDNELWSSLAKQGKDFVSERFQWSEAMVELERFLVQAAGEQKE